MARAASIPIASEGNENTRYVFRDLIEREEAAIRNAGAQILGDTPEFMHDQARYVAHMFYWLCGKGEEYRIIGGQAWPWSHPSQIGPSYGFASERGYLPDWRKQNRDGYAS